MTDWTTARVTPETLAELRRLLDAATPGPWRDEMMQGDGVTLTAIVAGKPNPDDLRVIGSTLAHNDARVLIAAVNALPALLDAAAERDALAATVERVRALPAKHPAGGWYMTSMRDVLAALDEEPQP